MKKQRREPYDPPRVIHDSFPKRFATARNYFWTPIDSSESGQRQRRKWLLKLYGKILPAKWTAQEDAERRRKLAKILEAVEQDKVLMALERAFDERVAEIQRYYLSEHEKEAEAAGCIIPGAA